jgi:cell fate regulator YaaT (PSP1 superfamily)
MVKINLFEEIMDVSAVKLRNSYQIYFVDTDNLFLRQNSQCVVEIEHGVDIGRVVKIRGYQNNPSISVTGKVLRKATALDLDKLSELVSIEDRAFAVCREKAKAKNLEMKLVSVKCLFDKTKIIFYFVAENRIDFRELVRELAAVFRTRIEMRQIGVRDEARIVGGYGPCGKPMCCLYQREEFEPVSIKMAKEQNLNLNSMKISGMCGRLLCCLGFEYDTYRELNEKLPEVDSLITAGDKIFKVVSVNTLKESVMIKKGDRFLNIRTKDMELRDGKHKIKDELIEELFKIDDEQDK